jgi:hypothetical protein
VQVIYLLHNPVELGYWLEDSGCESLQKQEFFSSPMPSGRIILRTYYQEVTVEKEVFCV